MRMWNVNPSIMCRQHLLGEHLEMHMFAGCISKGKSIRGYIENGLVDTGLIIKRHDKLAREIARRGFRHDSPIQKGSYDMGGFVDKELSRKELMERCKECRERIRGRHEQDKDRMV